MSELVLKRISKTYRNGFTALREVNLRLTDGVFALLGPNGAGKSTLMQIIAGLLKPSNGEVSIDGLTPRANLESYRVAVGYLPQSFGFPPGATVRSVLEHLGRLRGLEQRSLLAEKIERSLSSVNLLSRINARVSTLSGGMKQRLGIAQALVHSPSVLVLDEPTAGLDPEERNNFLLLLSEYANDHVIVLSTHLIDDVEAICQQMAFISEGTVLSSGNRDEVLTPLEGRVFALPPHAVARGRKLYDTVERGKPVGRYFVESGSRDAAAETPTVRDAYALAIPHTARR